MVKKTVPLLIFLLCLWTPSVVRANYQPPLDSVMRDMFANALDSTVAYCQVPGAVMAVKD
jgi:hypothetical protein